MTNSPSLVVQIPPGPTGTSLAPVTAIALPVMVDTAALAVSMEDGFHLLVNHSGSWETFHFRVRQSYQVEQLSALPLVGTGVVGCGQEIIVTGAGSSGFPQVLGVNLDSKVAWHFQVDDLIPIHHPVPGCTPRPVVAWQRDHGNLEVADCGPAGVVHRGTFRVGGPPLEIAFGHDRIWSAWATPTGIRLAGFGQDGLSSEIPASFASDMAVGAYPEGGCLVWTQSGTNLFGRVLADGRLAAPPEEIDLDGAAGGKLALVPGPEPLVWAQRVEIREGESPDWTSVLVIPGSLPIRIDGLVHAVAWWNEMVVIVGSETMHFLQRVPR